MIRTSYECFSISLIVTSSRKRSPGGSRH
jgi:hypothetical protein